MDITVVIPTHPARVTNGMTTRAVGSVLGQTRPADVITVEQDLIRAGAAITRHRGLMRVSTDWVAFLDSDDEFKPNHLRNLEECALQTKADYVYSWYDIVGNPDPMAQYFGVPFDSENPIQTTIVTLVRTELAQAVGFLDCVDPALGASGEDWLFTKKCVEQGAKIVHLPEKTWIWYHHGNNSSGLPGKGDAI